MNKVSFEEIGQVAATFYAAAGVSTGDVAKLSADSTVSACAAGDAFCGVALYGGEGFANVQIGGFARLKCADTAVKPGWQPLAADGNGGVKRADGAHEYLVVCVDTAESAATVCL